MHTIDTDRRACNGNEWDAILAIYLAALVVSVGPVSRGARDLRLVPAKRHVEGLPRCM